MMSRAAVLALPVLLLAACNTTGGSYAPPLPSVALPPSPGSIVGHGGFRLDAGGRASCAGFSVALMPDIPRYNARIAALYGSTHAVMEPVSDVKARSAKLPPSPDTAPVASASCDSQGEFSFPSLAAGGYFLIAHVKVKPARPGHDDFVVLRQVTVRPGEAADVSLAP